MNENSFVQSWHGIPREEITWCPTLVPERCDGCGLCVTSCDRHVLAFDYAKNLPEVVNGLNCVVGCTACAAVCLRDALALPCRGDIRQLIHERELMRHSEAELHAARAMYDVDLHQPRGISGRSLEESGTSQTVVPAEHVRHARSGGGFPEG